MIVVKNVKVEKKEVWIEENKLKENNKKTKREIYSCEIIKKIPNWFHLFFVINEHQETYFQQNHDLFVFNNIFRGGSKLDIEQIEFFSGNL
jgi:hypothetical protein